MSGVPHRECERLRDRLPEYADGSLAGPARVRIEAHLGGCPRCAAELADLRTMLRAVHSITPDEAPDDLLRRVREAVRARPPAPAGLPRLWPRIAVPVALAVGVVAIGFALRAPRERARMLAAPQGAPTQGDRLALGETGGRGATRGRGRAGGGAGPAAGGPAVSGPVVVAEATEEAIADRTRHRGRPNLGLDESAQLDRPAARPPPEPTETDRFLYADVAPPDATAPKPAAGLSAPPGPADTSEMRSPLNLEREGTAAGGIGGGLGGGGPSGGAGLRGGGRAGAPAAEKRAAHPGRARRGGTTGDQDARGPLKRMVRGDREDTLAGASEMEEVAPTPSLSATLGIAQYEGRPALTLQLASDKPAAEISVYLGDTAARRLVWQGSSPPTAPLLVTPDHIGPAPAATPLAIQAGEETRNYLLFTPTLARLGEVAESAPAGAYAGESVAQALAELTALTGLVVLAEEPLCQVLSGDKPAGAPDAALRELAARAGLEVERAGDLVFNLKHPR